MVLLSHLDALYRFERQWAELDDYQRYEQRQKIAIPRLIKIKQWLTTGNQWNSVLSIVSSLKISNSKQPLFHCICLLHQLIVTLTRLQALGISRLYNYQHTHI